jgi:hypothetical protein
MSNVKNFGSKDLTLSEITSTKKEAQSIEIYVRIAGKNDRPLQVSVGAERLRCGRIIAHWLQRLVRGIKGMWPS